MVIRNGRTASVVVQSCRLHYTRQLTRPNTRPNANAYTHRERDMERWSQDRQW